MKSSDITKLLNSVKKSSKIVGLLNHREKKSLLISLSNALKRSNENILEANRLDIQDAMKAGFSNAFIDRLTLTTNGFDSIVRQVEAISKFPDPVGEIIERRILKNGVNLTKQRFPIGVVFMIYESRPNVTIDAAALSLKSGNAIILKGGSEAHNTNKAFISILHEVLELFKIPETAVSLLEKVDHSDIKKLLKRSDAIDIVIPRGSYKLTSAVARESRIPILFHAAGGARMYVDRSADLKIALDVCVNAKCQRTSVCNAMDTLLVHKIVAKELLPKIDKELFVQNFEIRADVHAKKYMPHSKLAKEKDFATEFLDAILAVKVVNNAKEAIDFISLHTHKHTEILCANDKKVIKNFINHVDAAGLMINCSSRLHDGGEFGMGAEMGTATGKLHARGPVGVRELTTYKWIAYGSGQTR